jgi:LemA protein
VINNARSPRSAAAKAGDDQARFRAEATLGESLGRLFAVAEGYPDLKASQNFISLQNRISAIEEQIAHGREFYNDSANINNVRREQIPDVFLMGFVGLRERTLFEANADDRLDVDVAARLPR